MDKKLRLSIVYIVLLSLLIGSAILLSKPVDKNREIKNSINVDKSNISDKDNSDQDINAYKNEIFDSNDLVKKEAINVFNNGTDLDLHANLVENKNGQVSLNLAYKLKGKLITKNIDATNITEIRNIFRFREKYGSGYKLKNMLLNRKKDMIYFLVEGKQREKYTQTSIYSYNLKNSKIEKIFYDLGVFSEFSVSPDGKYNAFSYLNCPQNITRNEKSIVVIIRCADNKLVLNSREDITKKQFNKNNDLFVYSFRFIKWRSNSICQLSKIITTKDGSQKEREQSLFYNVSLNKMSEKVWKKSKKFDEGTESMPFLSLVISLRFYLF